jgi:hypothetical protein
VRAVTLKQLERKARQLLYRRRLAETVESLEEGIKAYLKVEDKDRVRTKSFVIRLDGSDLLVSVLPKIDPRQLKLRFKENR